jgi:hypothetical protein
LNFSLIQTNKLQYKHEMDILKRRKRNSENKNKKKVKNSWKA